MAYNPEPGGGWRIEVCNVPKTEIFSSLSTNRREVKDIQRAVTLKVGEFLYSTCHLLTEC